ncbi:MAG: hypothetical protein AVDCRST_MAG41-4345, partial [uncultured Corynebacteriales bacterium]
EAARDGGRGGRAGHGGRLLGWRRAGPGRRPVRHLGPGRSDVRRGHAVGERDPGAAGRLREPAAVHRPGPGAGPAAVRADPRDRRAGPAVHRPHRPAHLPLRPAGNRAGHAAGRGRRLHLRRRGVGPGPGRRHGRGHPDRWGSVLAGVGDRRRAAGDRDRQPVELHRGAGEGGPDGGRDRAARGARAAGQGRGPGRREDPGQLAGL